LKERKKERKEERKKERSRKELTSSGRRIE